MELTEMLVLFAFSLLSWAVKKWWGPVIKHRRRAHCDQRSAGSVPLSKNSWSCSPFLKGEQLLSRTV